MRPLLLVLLATAVHAEAIAWTTWTADPTTTLTLRVLADAPVAGLHAAPEGGTARPLAVSVRPVGDTGWSVHEATVDGLAPGSVCAFAIGDVASLCARTAPATLPLRFVAGGDLMDRFAGSEERFAVTCAAAAATDPAFALVGGDWAYDNGQIALFARWRTLLGIWRRTMVRADGCAIPIVAVIGNHEMAAEPADHRAVPFGMLFPEDTARSLRIGPVAFLLLDTGHARAIADQEGWLARAAAAERGQAWTIASYHVPAWPSVRDPEGDDHAAVRAGWVPILEREGVDLVLEHHDHALKRTHPLLRGRPHPDGITYLGDGSWGVQPRIPAPAGDRPYLAASASAPHVWSMTLRATEAECVAVGAGGAVLDRVTVRPRAPLAPTWWWLPVAAGTLVLLILVMRGRMLPTRSAREPL